MMDVAPVGRMNGLVADLVWAADNGETNGAKKHI